MQQLRTYLNIAIDLIILGFASLAEVDAELRVIAIAVGLILTVFTIVKVYHQIQEKKINNAFRKVELKEKEEQVRRFFELNYKMEDTKTKQNGHNTTDKDTIMDSYSDTSL